MGRVPALSPDHQELAATPEVEAPSGRGGIDFEDFFENGAVALHVVGRDGTILHANRAELELLGFPAEEYIGRNVVDFHADREVIEDILARLGRGETLDKYPARLRARDGSLRHVRLTSNGQFSKGEFVSTRCFTVDVSELVRAEQELRRSEEFNQRILESSQDCIKVLDLEGRLRSINACGCRYLGVEDASAIVGGQYLDLWQDADRPAAEAALAEARSGGAGRFTAQYMTPWGAVTWWDEIVTPILGTAAKPEQLLVVSRDITELKAANEQREALIQELDHRVKNSLAAVQSLANATLPPSPELQTFFGRLRALAEAHRLLADTRWDGGCLESIVTTILKPYSERAHVTGGGVRLAPKAAQTMCMVTNELATNAVKYGALSNPDGRIDVSWSVSKDPGKAALSLSWIEIGGPPVTDPTRQGFGTKLIREAVEYELSGRTELTYAPDGLRCTIELPWTGNIRKVRSPDCN